MPIIHKPGDLTNLSLDELDEVLLDETYNKPNLRQLVRMCINTIKEQQKLIEYCRENEQKAIEEKENYKKTMRELLYNEQN